MTFSPLSNHRTALLTSDYKVSSITHRHIVSLPSLKLSNFLEYFVVQNDLHQNHGFTSQNTHKTEIGNPLSLLYIV